MPENPAILFFDEAASSMDVAWQLVGEGRFDVWQSLLVGRQSAGRGRMGRVWQSPPGHVYAALRLPTSPPFDGPGAALALAALLAMGLADIGFPVKIKWPNDLVSEAGKVCGILLESKRNTLVAGVGINLNAPPPGEWRRDPNSLPPSALPWNGGPEKFWASLVKHATLHYNCKVADEAGESLVAEAEKALLWKGFSVRVESPACEPPFNGGAELRGVLTGLAPDGALKIAAPTGEFKIWSGGLFLDEDGRI